jgi:nitrogen fixation NifU-like protein
MEQGVRDLLRGHSPNFQAMVLENDRFERMRHPDGYAKCSRECGDTLEIFLTSQNGRIRSASFYTEGCLYTIACANAVVHMVEGKSIIQARAISPRQVSEFLETLPKAERHCAELAVRTLRVALIDLEKTARRPWTKFYREV